MSYSMNMRRNILLSLGCMLLLNSCFNINDYFDKHLYPKFDEKYPDLARDFKGITPYIKCNFSGQKPEYVDGIEGDFIYIEDHLNYPEIYIDRYGKSYLLVLKHRSEGPVSPGNAYSDMPSGYISRSGIAGYLIRGISRCYHYDYLIDSKNFADSRFDGIFLMTESGVTD